MSKEVVKKQIQALYKDEALETLTNIDQFNVLLNQPPPKQWIKVNAYANNSQYLPIDKVEYLLKKLFKQYRVEVISVSSLFNSVVTHVRLHYLNPVLNEWQYQDGVGAEQIQTKKGASPADFQNINNNALAMAVPKSKVAAIKDAAHELGAIFGANLSRKDVIELKPDDVLINKKFEAEKERMLDAIANGYEPTEQEKEYYGV